MTVVGPAAVRSDDHTVPGGPSGEIPVRIVRPRDARDPLPTVLYTNGAGGVDGVTLLARLVGDLVAGSGVAVVFPSGGASAEARYPIAIEECYAVAAWVCERGGEHGLDGTRLALVGDSVGADLATVVALLATERGGPALRAQILFCPTTDPTRDTASYREFASALHQLAGLPPALVITAEADLDLAASFLHRALF